jgi:stearoyl-CoA desaturase (delta-9 desaturase)
MTEFQVEKQTLNAPTEEDVAPLENERLHATASAVVVAVPFLCLGLVGWQVWGRALHWQDLVVLAATYVPICLGISVGFHRHFTHRAFKTGRAMRATLGVLGSAALEGPLIPWVATHRKHHAFSDREGDPHSPHVDHDGHPSGPLRGLFHAHLGWLFLHTQRPNRSRYAPDLLGDPVSRFVDRMTWVSVALGLAFPFGLGLALTGTLLGGLTGLLWGGAVRILLLHHVTYSINSLCHFFGRRRFVTGDNSRNLAWLAPLSLGEAWHNNHHAFPTSAAHGLRWWEVDVSAGVISSLERLGLIWDVVRIPPERQRRKVVQPPARHPRVAWHGAAPPRPRSPGRI